MGYNKGQQGDKVGHKGEKQDGLGISDFVHENIRKKDKLRKREAVKHKGFKRRREDAVLRS